jgi:hypothetical protein
MTDAAQADDAPHALRLAALVAAARLAAVQGRAELAAAAAQALEQAAQQAADLNVVVKQFVELARRGGDEAILPFTADPLTLACAALMYPRTARAAELRLYSRASVTDVGFMRCTFDGPVYVDRAPPQPGSERAWPQGWVDLPDLAVPEDWLDALHRSEAAPPQALLAPGAGDTIHLNLAPHEVPRWLAVRTRLRLTLLKPGGRSRVARRDLGPVAVKGQGGTGQTLIVGLSEAQQIELHAAFFDGWWMLIGEGELRALVPVPDLDPQAPPVPCRTDLPLCGQDSLPGSEHWVAVPAELVARLAAAYWWVAPVDSPTWLQMLTTSTGAAAERPR